MTGGVKEDVEETRLRKQQHRHSTGRLASILGDRQAISRSQSSGEECTPLLAPATPEHRANQGEGRRLLPPETPEHLHDGDGREQGPGGQGRLMDRRTYSPSPAPVPLKNTQVLADRKGRVKVHYLPPAESPLAQGIIGVEEDETGIGLCGWMLTSISLVLVMITLPFSLFVCFKVVQEYERAVIFRLGRLLSGGSKGPGIFFVMPCIETYQKVDLRTITLGVPPQEVLTKDSVTVSVDAVVYYRVSNATVSVANVENAHHSTRLLAQTTLRNILGTKNLHEILSDRESIAGAMQKMLDEATEPWGIKVERVEIKDARLPIQLQRAMAAEAEAAREARAKVIAAEGEQKASRALREASEVMSQSSAALQLRYLQTLNSISAEKNSTVIFPLPLDLVQSIVD